MRHATDSIVAIEQRRTKSERKCKFQQRNLMWSLFSFSFQFFVVYFSFIVVYFYSFFIVLFQLDFLRVATCNDGSSQEIEFQKTEWRPIGNGDTFSPLLKPLFGVDEENADRTQNAPKKNVLTVPTHTNTRINTKIILSFVLIFFSFHFLLLLAFLFITQTRLHMTIRWRTSIEKLSHLKHYKTKFVEINRKINSQNIENEFTVVSKSSRRIHSLFLLLLTLFLLVFVVFVASETSWRTCEWVGFELN